ncbi:MAG: hypothetical protein IEMM0007_1740 [bacterium]|nr:MAG: hypothetical protein IEMM0007_1740 [bacterium]
MDIVSISEAIITFHHPGETKVIIKTVQSLSYRFLSMIEAFYGWGRVDINLD